MFSSLRMQLTLWYVGALSLVLVLFSVGVFFFFERTLRERLDTNLDSTLQIASNGVARQTVTDSFSSGEALENPHFPDQVVALLDLEGRVLAKRPVDSALPLRLPLLPVRPSESPQFYDLAESRPDADNACRGVYRRVSDTSRRPYVLVVTQSSEPLSDQLDALGNGLMIAIVFSLLLAGSGGLLLARKSLAPVGAMAATAVRITAKNLEERLPVKNPHDELGRLASSFNNLLARLSAAFSQQRQFMADASHELRTPLSVIRTAAQITLYKPERPAAEYREAMAVIEHQTGRLARIVEDMFSLARADMGQLPLQTSDFYLDELIAEAVAALAVLAQRKGVTIELQGMEESPYRGDPGLLRQMICNLLDNAIKYTSGGGRVDIALQRLDGRYEITVSDTGVGIPNELQPHIFERFYRGDKTRTQAPEGAGLGLPIALSIAQLHHGELTLERSGAEGSTFRISVPMSSGGFPPVPPPPSRD